MLNAITHEISPNLNQCELSYLEKIPIDINKAIDQHEKYKTVLENCGVNVIELSANSEYPDSVFVEDTAVVVDEIAVMVNMGVESRKGEVRGLAKELSKYRKIAHIDSPGTLEGGDVLIVGKKIFVGISKRTNQAGFAALKNVLDPHGYYVVRVDLMSCLHLKSACTALDSFTMLVNPNWVDPEPFKDYRLIEVDESEPDAANSLRIKDVVIFHSGFPKTINKIRTHGYNVQTIDISELRKAEAGLTCSSIIFFT